MSAIHSLLNRLPTIPTPTPTPTPSPSSSPVPSSPGGGGGGTSTPTSPYLLTSTTTSSSSNTTNRALPRLHLPRAPPTSNYRPLPLPTPKPKIIKDAPIFTPGPPRGPVRFPPYVYDADTVVPTTSGSGSGSASAIKLVDYHEKFQLFPAQEDVAMYPRHIPYNSEKRVFLEKTGRGWFEVYQFVWRVPGDASGGEGQGKLWTMLWDYNTGLVRTTPLFKCCGYGKTTPAKMLNKNVGLRDICHSITGGALVAQGYWIPHLAAKHIAATFCYSIRYALTPVFGLDFIDMCVEPSDPRFGSMLIDESITIQCRQEAEKFRVFELENPTVRPPLAPGSRAGSPVGGGGGGGVRVGGSPRRLGGSTVLRFRAVNDRVEVTSSEDEGVRVSEVEDGEDEYVVSSGANSPRFKNVWKAKGAKGLGVAPRSVPTAEIEDEDEEMLSPKSNYGKGFLEGVAHMQARGMGGGGGGRGKGKRGFAEFEEGLRSVLSSPGLSPKMRKGQDGGRMEVDVDDGGYEAEGEEMEVDEVGGVGGDGGRRYHGDGGEESEESEAAKALLSLWGVHKKVDRRASA